jgi:methylglutaconyl-CoA hydratase
VNLQDDFRLLKIDQDGRVARITLNRPEVHNAFNPQLIDEIRRAFERAVEPQGQVHVIILAGAGPSFCAGADVNWMRESLKYTEAENVADALAMARMFETIDCCPVPVIARVQRAALGGGVGLLTVCDIVVVEEGTVMAFSEAKLGIAPAVISPYVLRKIGRTHARALFLTAERFGPERAVQIGLAHVVAPSGKLDEEVERIVGEVLSSAPRAVARAKALIAAVPGMDHDTATQFTAETIAALRVSPEGQDGLAAFLEKRKPGWVT